MWIRKFSWKGIDIDLTEEGKDYRVDFKNQDLPKKNRDYKYDNYPKASDKWDELVDDTIRRFEGEN